MLPRPLRLTRSAEHRQVARRGRPGRSGTLTVHVLAGAGPGPARGGLVVGRAVGNAVVRHRVSRQLRHLLRERLSTLPPGTLVVVRAGSAAGRTDLAADLDHAFRRAARPARERAHADRLRR